MSSSEEENGGSDHEVLDDERPVTREEYEVDCQDGANGRAHISNMLGDLKSDMAAKMTELHAMIIAGAATRHRRRARDLEIIHPGESWRGQRVSRAGERRWRIRVWNLRCAADPRVQRTSLPPLQVGSSPALRAGSDAPKMMEKMHVRQRVASWTDAQMVGDHGHGTCKFDHVTLAKQETRRG